VSILFKPIKLGDVELKNRFVQSATYECMARETGEVTDEIVNRYRNLAKGEVGLVIPGYMYVHPLGRAVKYQTGIHSDDMIPGLKKVVEAVRAEEGCGSRPQRRR
jgi:2,4-dienoyl-CoA reductase-like NADH-dependent reductase (Old Yellow Enzyme family)